MKLRPLPAYAIHNKAHLLFTSQQKTALQSKRKQPKSKAEKSTNNFITTHVEEARRGRTELLSDTIADVLDHEKDFSQYVVHRVSSPERPSRSTSVQSKNRASHSQPAQIKSLNTFLLRDHEVRELFADKLVEVQSKRRKKAVPKLSKSQERARSNLSSTILLDIKTARPSLRPLREKSHSPNLDQDYTERVRSLMNHASLNTYQTNKYYSTQISEQERPMIFSFLQDENQASKATTPRRRMRRYSSPKKIHSSRGRSPQLRASKHSSLSHEEVNQALTRFCWTKLSSNKVPLKRKAPSPFSKAEVFNLLNNSSLFDQISSCKSTQDKKTLEIGTILAKNCRNELEKVWSAFVWTCTNIQTEVNSGSRMEILDPDEIIKKGKTNSIGYSLVFKALCQVMEISVSLVKGETRSSILDMNGYRDRPHMRSSGHFWNIVSIGEFEAIVDCSWASGYVRDDQFVFAFEPAHFFPNPEHYIFHHLPENELNQLLEEAITKNTFDSLVYITDDFFRCQLEIHSTMLLMHTAKDGAIMTVKAPQNVQLTVSLREVLGDSRVETQDATFLVRNGDEAMIYTIFTRNGLYQLDIFAQKEGWTEYCLAQTQYVLVNTTLRGVDSSLLSFPRTYELFYELKTRLRHPIMNSFVEGQFESFRLNFDGDSQVDQVAIVQQGEEWEYLLCDDMANWECELTVVRKPVHVVVRLKGEDASCYRDILSYY